MGKEQKFGVCLGSSRKKWRQCRQNKQLENHKISQKTERISRNMWIAGRCYSSVRENWDLNRTTRFGWAKH